MKPTVYVETSVISYLTARPSRDVVVAGHQEVTRQWWASHTDGYQFFVSPLVLEELQAGDSQAAERRLAAASFMDVITPDDRFDECARILRKALRLPEKTDADLLRIADCVASEIDFLATWNCRVRA